MKLCHVIQGRGKKPSSVRHNGKVNGKHYNGLYIGIMEKKMETTMMGYILEVPGEARGLRS